MKTLVLFLMTFFLLGCQPEVSDQQSFESRLPQTTSFKSGSADSPRIAYVFFDPQCPHCAKLWDTSKRFDKQVLFVWIPVALLNTNSLTQAAAILNGPDFIENMNQHEKLLKENSPTRGIPINRQATLKFKEKIQENTELFKKSGATGVPYIVFKQNSQNMVTHSGSMSEQDLARFLNVPIL